MSAQNLGRSRAQANAPGAKRLVIKPFKLKPQLPDDFEAASWGRLREAVHAVQNKSPVSCSLEELYRAVEDLCLHKLSAKLYALLQAECDAHTALQLRALAAKAPLGTPAFLQHVGRAWQDYCDQLLLIRQIFLYLDRTYVLSTSGVRSLFDMGLQLFRTHLQQHPEASGRTAPRASARRAAWRRPASCAQRQPAGGAPRLSRAAPPLHHVGRPQDGGGAAAADRGRAQRRDGRPPAGKQAPATAQTHSAMQLPRVLLGAAITIASSPTIALSPAHLPTDLPVLSVPCCAQAKHLLAMLGSLGLYTDAFQRPFLERSAQYYQQEGERLMQVHIAAHVPRCTSHHSTASHSTVLHGRERAAWPARCGAVTTTACHVLRAPSWA
jgi:hypothetical protein